MPGENIYDWSITAASNDSADTLINWREGQARASVNDSARSMMAAHAKLRNLQNGSITTGGTANAQTFTSGGGYTSVPTGMRVLLKIGIANTGSATLNMDGISDAAIKNQAGANLTGGQLALGSYAEFRFDGTNWVLLFGPPSEFAAGTRMIFFQAAAPTGWTQVTSYNDHALRLVGGAGGNVATWFPFSTQFALRTSDAHALTDAEASPGTGLANFGVLMGLAAGGDFSSYKVETAGGGAGHTHQLDMRVSYVDVIICTKD